MADIRTDADEIIDEKTDPDFAEVEMPSDTTVLVGRIRYAPDEVLRRMLIAFRDLPEFRASYDAVSAVCTARGI